MQGAYCLTCLEDGPDLVLRGADAAAVAAAGKLTIEFGCGGCGRRWTWQVTATDGGTLRYKPIPTTAGREHGTTD